jgi:hypothetical protein
MNKTICHLIPLIYYMFMASLTSLPMLRPKLSSSTSAGHTSRIHRKVYTVKLWLFTGAHVHGTTQRYPRLEAQLQATLNVNPAYTWYALPSGALTFVHERLGISLACRKTIPLDSASTQARSGMHICSCYIPMTAKSHAGHGQSVCAPAPPVKTVFEFVTLKENTDGF